MKGARYRNGYNYVLMKLDLQKERRKGTVSEGSQVREELKKKGRNLIKQLILKEKG